MWQWGGADKNLLLNEALSAQSREIKKYVVLKDPPTSTNNDFADLHVCLDNSNELDSHKSWRPFVQPIE